jgi:hypothetical protein
LNWFSPCTKAIEVPTDNRLFLRDNSGMTGKDGVSDLNGGEQHGRA